VGRGGARPGDLLYLSGALGGPGAAVEAWSAGAAPDAAARTRFARPEARVALGAWLAAAGATAMIDISDGLLADAAHLAAASGVLLRLDPSLVPRLASVGVEAALRSGEEYELLAAAGPLDVVAAAAAGGVPLTCIGRVEATDGPPGVMVPGAGGGWVRVDRSGGWDHLS
jgi:thiamine-monophosphate kinase